MSSEELHEARDAVRPATRDQHRAIASLMEEMEAVDWYEQRIDATQDDELRAILAHNRDEEKEHAAMVIEWLRRHDEVFARQLRRFLFRQGPIVDGEDAGGAESEHTLGIGDLKKEKAA